ncbi:MAG: glycoside hydrolase family 2 TIM barrel-domain containing protein [Spirochaetota bacterium]
MRSTSGYRHVTVAHTGGRYRLTRDGEPLFVKGAGSGAGRIESLAAHGANSMRTWSTQNAKQILDDAEAAGLTVLLGLRATPERHGFDYDDSSAVREQLERMTEEVRAFREHPALLAWGIGNELNLSYSNPAVWNAVNDIARMIHDVDGHHPATTMIAGVSSDVIGEITTRAPDLDFLSIQMYGSVDRAPELIADAGYTGPYLFTEWGATGHWEVRSTGWNAPIEQTSSEKADAILERYKRAILDEADRCMGSYVFLWGQKQERTPTWYGLFTEDGRETEAVDAMEYLWTGSWPEHRAPRLTDITVDGAGRYDDVRLAPAQETTAVLATDATGRDDVEARAEILPEATVLGEGGDFEPRPEAIPGLVRTASPGSVEFAAPGEPGAYRLFVYLLDGSNHAATANLPVFVDAGH